jgi:hypothetical protein
MKSIRTPLERDVKALQRQLQIVFENAQHQDAALVGIYKLFIPDWENIKQVEGFPTVGREMWKYIASCSLILTSSTILKYSRVVSGSTMGSHQMVTWTHGRSVSASATSFILEPETIKLKSHQLGEQPSGGFLILTKRRSS